MYREQVRAEDIKLKDLERGLFKPPKKELKYLQRHNGDRERHYIYLDPIPSEMRALILMELCTVQIDWKMLTTLRPKTKIEEEYYSKCDDMTDACASVRRPPLIISLFWQAHRTGQATDQDRTARQARGCAESGRAQSEKQVGRGGNAADHLRRVRRRVLQWSYVLRLQL